MFVWSPLKIPLIHVLDFSPLKETHLIYSLIVITKL
jgi:hypothetical protein